MWIPLCFLPDLQQTPTEERRSITDSLIAQRNLSCPTEKETPESISKALASLLTIRLDRENICTISNLQGLREVRSLYLQELLPPYPTPPLLPCRFLSLAGNLVRVVENLQDLRQLQFLDLSQNRIETLDPGRSSAGNSLCWTGSDTRHTQLAALPCLPLNQFTEPAPHAGLLAALTFPTLSPLPAEFFAGLRQELAGRSQRRRQEALSEHQARLEELTERQRLMQPPGDLGPGSRKGPAEEGAAGGRSPAPGLLEPHPKSGSRLLSLPKARGSTRSGTPRTGGQSKRGSGARLKPPKWEASTIVKTAARATKK
uniref:Leucine-rich repeat-containing protein 46 n=1 Tax=Chelonoidis abingdonii TaxID=106734 RepID=A0A8C0ILH2_CHEAB